MATEIYVREVTVTTETTGNLLPNFVQSFLIENQTGNVLRMFVNGTYYQVDQRSAVTVFGDPSSLYELTMEAVAVPATVTLYASFDGTIRVGTGLKNVILKYHAGTLARCPSVPYCL